MGNFELSLHALEQMELRQIPKEVVFEILQNPDKVEVDGYEQYVYQKLLVSDEGKEYIVRVFVNSGKSPNLVKTVYRTSKISKYQ